MVSGVMTYEQWLAVDAPASMRGEIAHARFPQIPLACSISPAFSRPLPLTPHSLRWVTLRCLGRLGPLRDWNASSRQLDLVVKVGTLWTLSGRHAREAKVGGGACGLVGRIATLSPPSEMVCVAGRGVVRSRLPEGPCERSAEAKRH